MARNLKITEGSIIKPLLYFFFPILIGTFFQQLYNTVDALIVGNFLGKEALAAVGGTTSTYLNLFIGFFVGLSSGASVLISQYYGSRNYEAISKTVHTSMLLSIVLGLLLTVIGSITARSSLIFLNVPTEILDLSLDYIYIYFFGFIIMLIYNMGCSILRAVGDSKSPLYFLIISCIVNIILDVLFVYNFNMGIKGAAFATVLAQVVAAALIILSLIKSEDALHLSLRLLKIDKDISKNIFKIGFPSAVESILYTVSNLIIASAINNFGVDLIAANTAYGKVDAIYWMALQAFAISITTFVGQNYGANRMDRVKKGINEWMGLAMVVTIIMAIICVNYAPNLLHIFNSDPNVIKIGIDIMLIIAPCWVLFIPVEIISGGLRGLGDTLIPTIITAIGIVGFRTLWFILLPDQSIFTIFIVYPITWAITSLATLTYYYGGLYKKRLKLNV